MQVIARVRNDFPTKFGLPRQSGLAPVEAMVVFEPPYRVPEALRGLGGLLASVLIWGFHRAERASWSPTVRPPRLGGNRRVGVFATRSPFRPNLLGLSCVRLERVIETPDAGMALVVSGADMMDGTAGLRYQALSALRRLSPGGVGGFAEAARDYGVQVSCPEALLSRVRRIAAPRCWPPSRRTRGPRTSGTSSAFTECPTQGWTCAFASRTAF